MLVTSTKRKTVKDDYAYKHVHKIGEEDEGAHPAHRRESSSFHGDSSVEVSGNEGRECDGDCDFDCDCDDCRVCDSCESHQDNCDCTVCQRCHECDSHYGDCGCYVTSAANEDCDECKFIHENCSCNEESEACETHQLEAFENNSYQQCDDTYMQCQGDCGCEIYHECGMEDDNGLVDGEMVSPPLLPAHMAEWSRENYPSEVNTSCGSHQHTSFKLMKDYCIALDRDFETYLIQRLASWGKKHNINAGSALYSRLAGDKHWCRKGYRGYDQLITSDKSDCRYQIVNYCYLLHGTMEVRVLPAFAQVELNVSAHKELTRAIEQFIEDNKDSLQQRRKTITMEVMV